MSVLIMHFFIFSQPLLVKVENTNTKTLKAAINIIDAILNKTGKVGKRQINYNHHGWSLMHYFCDIYVYLHFFMFWLLLFLGLTLINVAQLAHFRKAVLGFEDSFSNMTTVTCKSETIYTTNLKKISLKGKRHHQMILYISNIVCHLRFGSSKGLLRNHYHVIHCCT